MKALFITFEGIEGSGKSTVANALRDAFERAAFPVIFTREPGGNTVSENIRSILLDPNNAGICPLAELFLYEASRAQIVDCVIRPALAEGRTVICDRFMDASVAYQGWARGLGDALVEDLNALAVGGTVPDITFLLDCSVEDGFRRGPHRREETGDRGMDRLELEGRLFHERVREGYLRIAKRERKRIVVIDASLPLERVVAEVIRNIRDRFRVKI